MQSNNSGQGNQQQQQNSQQQQQGSQQQQPNRLHLNFNFNGQGTFAGEQGRAFPTTPSTFPQPLPNAAGQQQEVWGTNQQSNSGFTSNGYFMNNPYTSQMQQQQNQLQAQNNLQAPTPSYRSPLSTQSGFNDATNGLAQQFAHQNLNNQPRTQSPYGRQPSPGQRPRTAGQSPSPNPQYGQFLGSVPQRGPSVWDEEPPEKSPDRYASGILSRGKLQVELVGNFFRDNVERARERNGRAQELEANMRDPRMTDQQKLAKSIAMRKSEVNFLRFLRTSERPENYRTVKIIGKGAFGEVRLVQRKHDNKVYALKSLIKEEMFKKDQLAHVRAERDILANADSPWLVKLHTSFQDMTYLYMLMEFLPGGDLMTMLIKYEIFSEDITRFYMAELVLAIEAVHKLGYIHRDIKPDNVLLDKGGHIKLTDFGLSTGFHKEHSATYYQNLMNAPAKQPNQNRNSVSIDQIQLTVSNRNQINTWRKSRRQLAYSTVGTPDYIAPEIFSGRGYDYACDWWSVGTIMFECLIGWPPFCAEQPHDTYRKIVDWRRHLHFPPEQPLTPDTEDFVKRLICDPNDRLGRKNGAAEIKLHPFFRGVVWDQLRRIRAPFEPKLQSATDTQYFPIDDISQTDNSAALRAQNEAMGEQEASMSLPFIGYTYKRFDAFRGT